MKLDLPTPGVPVSPTRSVGAGSLRQRLEKRPRLRPMVGPGRFDQRDRAGQRTPVARRQPPRPAPPPPCLHASFTIPRRLGPWPSPASLAYPGPTVPSVVERAHPMPKPLRAARVALLALALAAPAQAAPPRPSTSPSSAIRVGELSLAIEQTGEELCRHHPHRHRRHRGHLRRLLLRRPVERPHVARTARWSPSSSPPPPSRRARSATAASSGRTARR